MALNNYPIKLVKTCVLYMYMLYILLESKIFNFRANKYMDIYIKANNFFPKHSISFFTHAHNALIFATILLKSFFFC